MVLPTFVLRCGLAVLTALSMLAVVSSASAQQGPLPPESDHSTFFRADPKVRGASPIAENEMKVGSIYNFYSTKLNRRAWSIYMGNGQFWHAMGPGSVQSYEYFDFGLSKEQIVDMLREAEPELAKQINIYGESIYFMLGDNGRWRLIPRASVLRIKDAETGLEWEKQFGSYLHVIPRGSMLGIGLGCCGWCCW